VTADYGPVATETPDEGPQTTDRRPQMMR